MSYTVSLAQRVAQLKRIKGELDSVLSKAQEQAAMRAVEAAAEATPPKAETGRGSYIGVNTITGQLKASWAKDSQTKPDVSATAAGKKYTSLLCNNMQYASYVNDGHRMDRHFVPGLYVDQNGLLSYDPSADVGLVVGTKTLYVKGEYMTDKGLAAYQKAILDTLDSEIRGMMR